MLRIDAPAVIADELPDLADAWAWAHVQSLVGLDGAAAAVSAGTGEVVARLLCPRRLLPDSSWLACVVPAFDGGVLAGRGETVPAGPEWQAAWDRDTDRWPGPLPVYHHWRFSTGQGGDFETLCRRLAADDSGVAFGLQAMDVGDPGLMEPAARAGAARLRGRAAHARRRAAPVEPQRQGRVPAARDRPARDAAVRADVRPPDPEAPYDPRRQDPVVGPPLYGQWPAGVHRGSRSGLGARAQPGSRRARRGRARRRARCRRPRRSWWRPRGTRRARCGRPSSALNQGRLAVEAGRRLTGAARRRSTTATCCTSPRRCTRCSAGRPSVRARLATGAVPAGLVSHASTCA